MSFNHVAGLRRGMRTALIPLLLLVGLVVAMSWRSAAHADPSPYPPTPACTLSSTGAIHVQGKSVGIEGSGFPANKVVQLSLQPPYQSLGTITTNADGAFKTTLQLPVAIASTGQHIVADTGSTSCQFDPFLGVDNITVHRTVPTHGVDGVTVHRTAETGFQTLTATGVAAILLVGGGALLLVGRRRRNRV